MARLLNDEARFSWTALSLSVCYGLVFGTVDSLIISFGLDSMAPYLPGDEIERAGWANAVSNGVGALLGAAAASALRMQLRLSSTTAVDGPVYGTAIGIVAGCALGIQISRLARGGGAQRSLPRPDAAQPSSPVRAQFAIFEMSGSHSV